MRFVVLCILTIGVAVPAAQSVAQTGPGLTLAPSRLAAGAPAVEPSSEPWRPPTGSAATVSPAGAAPSVAPVAELPIPGSNDPDPAVAAAIADPSTKLIVEEPDGPWYAPTIWLGPAPWDSGVELGLNGSSGTSDSLSIRTGVYIKRESRFSKLDFSTDYNLTTSGGESTQNNAQLDLTNDWLIDEKSPWTLFAMTDVFYDQFAAFNLETNVNLGVGYRLVHTPELELMTRVGGGASREFGGENDAWVPESLFGFEYSQRITKTQKFYGKIEYFPDWERVGEFRALADAGWEIELVQPSNLSLKLSASDRYDSTPDGVSPHLLNYSVLLLLKL